jgi:hypothetical protein
VKTYIESGEEEGEGAGEERCHAIKGKSRFLSRWSIR